MPKVSVICTNYNKGKWIADAIDSFLRQKTNFEFEIILVDDCSTDESVDIIRNYGQRYPDKIRTFSILKIKGLPKLGLLFVRKLAVSILPVVMEMITG